MATKKHTKAKPKKIAIFTCPRCQRGECPIYDTAEAGYFPGPPGKKNRIDHCERCSGILYLSDDGRRVSSGPHKDDRSSPVVPLP